MKINLKIVLSASLLCGLCAPLLPMRGTKMPAASQLTQKDLILFSSPETEEQAQKFGGNPFKIMEAILLSREVQMILQEQARRRRFKAAQKNIEKQLPVYYIKRIKQQHAKENNKLQKTTGTLCDTQNLCNAKTQTITSLKGTVQDLKKENRKLALQKEQLKKALNILLDQVKTNKQAGKKISLPKFLRLKIKK